MKEFTAFGNSVSPKDLVARAVSDLNELGDWCSLTSGGMQLHRSAVCGKRMVVKIHQWNPWAHNGKGGRSVSLRVEGQYTDYARATLETTAQANAFAAELQLIIDADPIPVK